MDDHHFSRENQGAFTNVEDPLISYRQPIVTASGLLLAFTLGFAKQWVQAPNPLGAWADYTIGAFILAGTVMLIVAVFRILNANYPRDRAASYYARTLRLFIGGISLNFIGLFGDLFITFLYTLHQASA
jgi:hypothetical protein